MVQRLLLKSTWDKSLAPPVCRAKAFPPSANSN